MEWNAFARALRAAVASCAALLAASAYAQTWNGAGGDNNWSTGANWVGGVAPASGASTLLSFPAGSARFGPVVDAPWTVTRIDIPSATPYTIAGQAITFSNITGNTAINTSLGAHTISAPIVIGPFTLDVSNASALVLSGPISGPNLAKNGAGTLTLSGASTFSSLWIGGGALVITGSAPLATTSVLPGATLAGTGTLGPVLMVDPTSVISPGLFPGPSPGILDTGNLQLIGVARIDIQGPTSGTQYDNINVTGTVNLLTPTLALSGAYVPSAGEVFQIITNDGTDAVSGFFDGLPEGATVTFNGVRLRVSYLGGTGNDVTLTALAAAAAPVPTLSGWATALVALAVLAFGMRAATRARQREKPRGNSAIRRGLRRGAAGIIGHSFLASPQCPISSQASTPSNSGPSRCRANPR